MTMEMVCSSLAEISLMHKNPGLRSILEGLCLKNCKCVQKKEFMHKN